MQEAWDALELAVRKVEIVEVVTRRESKRGHVIQIGVVFELEVGEFLVVGEGIVVHGVEVVVRQDEELQVGGVFKSGFRHLHQLVVA